MRLLSPTDLTTVADQALSRNGLVPYWRRRSEGVIGIMVVTTGREEALRSSWVSTEHANRPPTNRREPIDELGLGFASIDNDVLDQRRPKKCCVGKSAAEQWHGVRMAA
jgi:hypothetical protein